MFSSRITHWWRMDHCVIFSALLVWLSLSLWGQDWVTAKRKSWALRNLSEKDLHFQFWVTLFIVFTLGVYFKARWSKTCYQAISNICLKIRYGCGRSDRNVLVCNTTDLIMLTYCFCHFVNSAGFPAVFVPALFPTTTTG